MPTPCEPGSFYPDSYGTVEKFRVQVPLVPVDTAYEWYQNDSAHFVDARSRNSYDTSHITGAVHSPASEGLSQDDPTEEWAKSERIVTYCGCPHHYSTERAAVLLQNCYEEVYAIDEGFFEWRDRGYPVTGNATNFQAYALAGATDPADAGKDAEARCLSTGQREATRIQSDGTYQMTIHLTGVSQDAPITVTTPSYEITAPLSEITSGVITGP